MPRKRGADAWEHRYPDRTSRENPSKLSPTAQRITQRRQMWQHIDTLLWKLNANTPQNISQESSFSGVCDRYIQDERLREISELKRGQQNTFGGLKVSTATMLLPDHRESPAATGGDTPMTRVTPMLIQDWFKIGLQRSQQRRRTSKPCSFAYSRRRCSGKLYQCSAIQWNLSKSKVPPNEERGRTS